MSLRDVDQLRSRDGRINAVQPFRGVRDKRCEGFQTFTVSFQRLLFLQANIATINNGFQILLSHLQGSVRSLKISAGLLKLRLHDRQRFIERAGFP